MVDLSKEEAKVALIAMTKDVMQFDGNRGLKGEDDKPQGALVFKKDDNTVRGAYLKIADMAGYKGVATYAVSSPGSKPDYEIVNPALVKAMCGYCQDLGRSR
jgi:hypothetical protein